MALAAGTSRLTTSRLTLHTLTNAQLLQQWLPVSLQIEGTQDRPGTVTVDGAGWSRPA
jgi:RNA 3'-terminal phosphate cyclase